MNPNYDTQIHLRDRLRDPVILIQGDGSGDNPMEVKEHFDSLERPGSPLSLEAQRAPKRVKEKDVHSRSDHDDSAMDAALTGLNGFKCGIVAGAPNVFNSGVKPSFDDMLKDAHGMTGVMDNGGYHRQDIIVNNEDVVVDLSGPYPAINFSEKVHEHIAHSMRRTVINLCAKAKVNMPGVGDSGALSVATEQTSTGEQYANLYGHWMLE
ncbi:hypothetical protein V6N13_082838 [Hibiscus sabdariffa]|uniref:Uncharacterized protein n=1 Tax=Hibiscus sabdariffa TaxID=183260 RepID=A0ABR2BZS7_9ROSI